MIVIRKSHAFTLAEIVIVLSVIGIISAILLPVAISTTPDENVMKFKKGHSTLYKVINEMVTSEKYFKNGDLGIKANGQAIYNSGNISDTGYFCSVFGQIVSTKEMNCVLKTTQSSGIFLLDGKNMYNAAGSLSSDGHYYGTLTNDKVNTIKRFWDEECKKREQYFPNEIVTNDGIVYFKITTAAFGSQQTQIIDENGNPTGVSIKLRYFSPPNQQPASYGDENGFDIAYMPFCVDIDGIKSGDGTTCDDIKDVCPFGYGIRADGKIMNGARADEWLQKNMQNND